MMLKSGAIVVCGDVTVIATTMRTTTSIRVTATMRLDLIELIQADEVQ